MQYRTLGKSDLTVSELALGSWLTYGIGVSHDRAKECVDRAFEVGINFIDTSNIYGKGAAESLLGEILQSRPRSSYILATKLFFPMTETDRGLSAAQIHKQLDASLKRLRTDYVDLYQCHRFDSETPLEETMQALTEVVQKGKARYVGFSEWTPEQIQAALDIPHVVRFVSSQPQYSILWRKPENGVIPLCAKHGISQIVWSPLAQGVLTGKYKPGSPLPLGSRATSSEMNKFMRPELLNDRVLAAVQQLGQIAQSLNLSVAQLALAWVLREPNVAAAIIGASRPEQVTDNAAASGVKLSRDVLRRIDAVMGTVVLG
jgi:aryl-alcohol dehydrogenase-like predicted oxidoreductase